MKFLKIAALCLALCGVTSGLAFTPKENSPLTRPLISKFKRNHQRLANGIIPGNTLNLKAQNFNNGPRRITAGGTNLYGYLYTGGTPGLYRFNETGFTKMWTDPNYNPSNWSFVSFESCWYRDGKICGYLLDTDDWGYGMLMGLDYYEVDFNSGQITKNEYMEYDLEGYFLSCAYDADEDMVYGYGPWDEEGESALFFKVNAKTPWLNNSFTDIKDYGANPSTADFNKQCFALCWNPIDGLLYGINLHGQVVTINKSTGDQTVIMNIPSDITFDGSISGLAYSPKEDLYYWERNYVKGMYYYSDLYTIDLNTKTFTMVENLEGAEQFNNFWVIGDNISANAPKKPTFVSADFEGTGLSGSLTYTMPTQLMNGDAVSGNLNWTMNVNGASYSTGSAAAGSTVTVPVTVSSAGNYTFDFTASANGQISAPASYTMYIGSDRPKAPTNVTLSENLLYWSKVTEGVNGGYIDPNSIEYAVYLNGEYQATVKTNTYNITIPQDKPWGDWTAYVVAIADGKASSPGYSNTIKAGGPWQLPLDMLCNQENYGYVQIVNANNDDEFWEYVNQGYDYWFSGQVDDKPAGDDWIILPPIAFPNADAYYSFSIDARKHAGTVYPDTWLEVKYGPIADPAMMDGLILDKFQPQNRDFATYTNPMFQVPAAGTWYIGIRCTTAVGQLGCDVSRIRVESNGYDLDGPGECTNVTLAPTSKTALDAKVTFTLPTKTLGGATIPADSDITAVITCGDNKTTVTGKPGETTSGIVATSQGENVVFLQCFLGDLMGAAMQFEIYTGEVVPGYVKDLTGVVNKNMMEVDLSWGVPTPWSNYWEGGINPETTWYNILVSSQDGYNDVIKTPMGVTQYTVTLPEGAKQDIYTIGVQAENVAGNNNQYMALTAVLGTPLGLPMNDEFGANGFKYQPWVSYAESESGVSWTMLPLEEVATDWAGNKEYALVGYTSKAGSDEALLGMPRFKTRGQNEVAVEMTYYAGIEAANLDVQAGIYGQEVETLFSWTITGVDSPTEFRTQSAQLPASMLGQDWVQVYLHPYFSNTGHYAIITQINVYGDKDTGLLMTMDFNGSIASIDNGIEIRGYEGRDFIVSDLKGVVYAKGLLDGDSRFIPLEPGIYVVKAGEKTCKVVVK